LLGFIADCVTQSLTAWLCVIFIVFQHLYSHKLIHYLCASMRKYFHAFHCCELDTSWMHHI